MPRYLSDTHPEAHAIQMEILRQKSPAERYQMMLSLTAFAVGSSRRGIQQARPDLSPNEQRLLWIEMNYGSEIADRIRTSDAHDAR